MGQNMVKHGETINLKYLKTKISCDAPVLTPDRETGTLPANLLQILNVGTKGAGMELEAPHPNRIPAQTQACGA